MSTYASLSDLQRRYGEAEITALSDRANSGDTDLASVSSALTDAAREMDSYLGAALRLPIATPYPELLVRLNCDIARHVLYKDAVPEAVKDARDNAIALLRRISSGEAVLPGLSADAPAPSGTGAGYRPAVVFTDAMLARMGP